MILKSYLFHLRARNLSPRTITATQEYLRPFLACHDPYTTTKRDIEIWLGDMAQRCKPSTVWTSWRHLKGLFTWLHTEGDISCNPMVGVAKPIVPPSEIPVLTATQVRALLATCVGKDTTSRRDYAILTIMLDSGLRLSEITQLTIDDVSQDGTLRVFGKGRKWRTVALGTTASTALARWMRIRTPHHDSLWSGRNGALTAEGIRKVVERRGRQAGFHLHAHMLRHTFVDNWLRNGGAEVDLARLAGWTSTRMAERYAQHRADERAVSAHKSVAPLDSLSSKWKTHHMI
jgi:integrase/recombinase XerC